MWGFNGISAFQGFGFRGVHRGCALQLMAGTSALLDLCFFFISLQFKHTDPVSKGLTCGCCPYIILLLSFSTFGRCVCVCVCGELCYKESTVISRVVYRNSKRTSFPLQCFKQQGAEGPSLVPQPTKTTSDRAWKRTCETKGESAPGSS